MEEVLREIHWVAQDSIVPEVDATQEFLEIATDFANPLDIIREAISNAYDAKASLISLSFDSLQMYGDYVLQITMEDNGEGMDLKELKSFFDLGSSTRRAQKHLNAGLIGEKGHGTKIFFNSDRVEVTTSKGGDIFKATMDKPFAKLHEGKIPEVTVLSSNNENDFRGTRIVLVGYNKNRQELFNHERIVDHIRWFTKHGSIENVLVEGEKPNVVLNVKGVDVTQVTVMPFGHLFPQVSTDINKLFDEHLAYAPKYFCRRWIKNGTLRRYPNIKYEAVFYLEGDQVKKGYNPMLKRPGSSKPGAYQVQDRYGLWLTKDYIPVQRKNEWITTKGSEFTRFHAFVNCQALRLTANRSSLDNTHAEILADLEEAVKALYNEIQESDDWAQLDYLEESATGYVTEEKERKEYERRSKAVKTKKHAEYEGVELIEPRQENGVYALVVALKAIDKDTFPFHIVDYDTRNGIDVLAKTTDNVDVGKTNLKYLEFKYQLTDTFNHSFKYLHSIVCWKTLVQHEGVIEDVSGKKRKMVVTPISGPKGYTRYMLDDPQEPHKIEVYVLEEYLREHLGIVFGQSGHL
jgi:hypothetical protein